jgi:hypothetical protein
MKELVEYIVKALVDKPDEVQISQTEGESVTVIEIRVALEDTGKVIGVGFEVSEIDRSAFRRPDANSGGSEGGGYGGGGAGGYSGNGGDGNQGNGAGGGVGSFSAAFVTIVRANLSPMRCLFAEIMTETPPTNYRNGSQSMKRSRFLLREASIEHASPVSSRIVSLNTDLPRLALNNASSRK